MEEDGIERGLAAMLEELQRVRQHGFTDSELEREKVNLLSLVESSYKQRDQTPSASLADSYVDHFTRSTPFPGIDTEWELYQELLPEITPAAFDEIAESWTSSEDTGLLVVRDEETMDSSQMQNSPRQSSWHNSKRPVRWQWSPTRTRSAMYRC